MSNGLQDTPDENLDEREMGTNIFIVSFKRLQNNIQKSTTEFLCLFYLGRDPQLNQRTVCHLGLLINLIDDDFRDVATEKFSVHVVMGAY